MQQKQNRSKDGPFAAPRQTGSPERAVSRWWIPFAGVLLCALWAIAYAADEGLPWFVTCAFGWALSALVVGYVVAASVRGRGSRTAAKAVTALSAVAMVNLWCWLDLHAALVAQVLALNAVVLALCARLHWYRLRLAALAWTMLAMASEWAYTFRGYGPVSPVQWCLWAWALFALVTADVMLRVWRADLPRPRRLDPALASIAMAAMFAGTYSLLNASHHAWMGPYAAAIGACVLAAAWTITVRRRWRGLGNAYLGQGIALITLAVPIQFDAAAVTIAWTVWAMVVFIIGRVASRPALRYVAWAITALALGKLLMVDMRQVAASMRSPASVYITAGAADSQVEIEQREPVDFGLATVRGDVVQ